MQENARDTTLCTFWLANCCELLNFLRNDGDISSSISPEPHDSMAAVIETAFNNAATVLKYDLHSSLPRVLDGNLDDAASVCKLRKCSYAY